MSRDFFLLIDTAVSSQAVREDLVNAYGFTPDRDGELVGPALSVVVRPSTNPFLAEPGIANPTLTVKLMPNA